MWSRRQITAGIASMFGIASAGIATATAATQMPSNARLALSSKLLSQCEAHEDALLNAGKIEEYFEQVEKYRSLCSEMAKIPANTLEELLMKASHIGWCKSDLEENSPEAPQSILEKSIWRDLARLSNAEVYDA